MPFVFHQPALYKSSKREGEIEGKREREGEGGRGGKRERDRKSHKCALGGERGKRVVEIIPKVWWRGRKDKEKINYSIST